MIFFVLLNIFVAIKSESLLEGKADGQVITVATVSYAAKIIYYKEPNREERVFTGVMVTGRCVLTVSHEARFIRVNPDESSDSSVVYDAWIVFREGNQNVNSLSETSIRPDAIVDQKRVGIVRLLDSDSDRGASPNIAVLVFLDPEGSSWAKSTNYPEEDCRIEGEGYYDVLEHRSMRLLGVNTVAIIKRKSFTVYESDDCYTLYGIDLRDTQFCGIPDEKMTFSEEEEGAGLIQGQKVIGLATHSETRVRREESVVIVIFEKVAPHGGFIHTAGLCSIQLLLSETNLRMSRLLAGFSN